MPLAREKSFLRTKFQFNLTTLYKSFTPFRGEISKPQIHQSSIEKDPEHNQNAADSLTENASRRKRGEVWHLSHKKKAILKTVSVYSTHQRLERVQQHLFNSQFILPLKCMLILIIQNQLLAYGLSQLFFKATDITLDPNLPKMSKI